MNHDRDRDPRRATSRWPQRLVLLVIACASIIFVWDRYYSWPSKVNRRLDEALADANRRDPRWGWEELLEDRKPVPDERNSWLVVKEIWSRAEPDVAYSAIWDKLRLSPNPPALWPESDVAALKKLLAEKAEVVRIGRQLADIPEGRMPADTPTENNFHFSRHDFGMSEHLRADAMAHSLEGDTDRAFISLRASLNSCRVAGDVPNPAWQVPRLAGRGKVTRLIEQVLAQGQPSAAELLNLQKLLQDEDRHPGALIAWRGMRAAWDHILSGKEGLDAFSYGPQGLQRGNGVSSPPLDMAFQPLLQARTRDVRATVLAHMNECIEIAKRQDPPQPVPILSTRELPSFCRLISNGSLLLTTELDGRARLRTAIAALAAERFRLDRNRWPDTLAELVPDYLEQVPADPYDLKPLRSKPLSDGWLVWSVDTDGKDDGGKLDRTGKATTNVDVGFQLWNPEARGQPAPGSPPPANDKPKETPETKKMEDNVGNPSARMIHYSGRVQGVGFRYTAVEIARAYPVAGWVKNLPDGRVQLLVEGPDDAVKDFLQAIRDRWKKNLVKEESKDEEVTGKLKSFIQR